MVSIAIVNYLARTYHGPTSSCRLVLGFRPATSTTVAASLGENTDESHGDRMASPVNLLS